MRVDTCTSLALGCGGEGQRTVPGIAPSRALVRVVACLRVEGLGFRVLGFRVTGLRVGV